MTTETADILRRPRRDASSRLLWALPVLRIATGLVFLWPFLDKLLALGFATGRNPRSGAVQLFGPDSWLNGGSPTKGFLSFGVKGPLASAFHAMAGTPVVDLLFMAGMGGVGIALVLGIATRIATVAGIALMLLLPIAVWESPNNPIVDEHLVTALVLIALAAVPDARRFSLDARWQRLSVVRRFAALR